MQGAAETINHHSLPVTQWQTWWWLVIEHVLQTSRLSELKVHTCQFSGRCVPLILEGRSCHDRHVRFCVVLVDLIVTDAISSLRSRCYVFIR